MSNLLSRYMALVEASGTLYTSPSGYSARVISKKGKHVAKFFKNGEYMKHADYEGTDEDDAHDFAREEMKHRTKEKNESVLNERINKPQGHLESADPITDDSETGRGRTKKMMGNRTPLEIIAKILAGK